MRTIDFSPLFRHSVGFDHMQCLLDAAVQTDPSTNSYPPYNIVQVSEEGYRISLAVAGFSDNELDVTVTDNTLVVSGRLNGEDKETTYLHRGIAGRPFERRFQLADDIKVMGSSLVNGLLSVDLLREVPEEKKPRKIAIATKDVGSRIEDKAA
ncbi:MAG: Hsp20 family protein [Rhodospirillales bacterium]|nr:Hsp20 family protein [Rhodospirillales bacterium]